MDNPCMEIAWPTPGHEFETIKMDPRMIDQIMRLAPRVQRSLRQRVPSDRFFIDCFGCCVGEPRTRGSISLIATASKEKGVGARANPRKGTIEIFPIERCFGVIGIAKALCHEVAHLLDERLRDDWPQAMMIMRQMQTCAGADRYSMSRAYRFMPSEIRAEATGIVEILFPWLARNKPSELLAWALGGSILPKELRHTYLTTWRGTSLESELREIALWAAEKAGLDVPRKCWAMAGTPR